MYTEGISRKKKKSDIVKAVLHKQKRHKTKLNVRISSAAISPFHVSFSRTIAMITSTNH